MTSKRQLTLDWCLSLGRPASELEQVYHQIWRNIKPDGGYRLTQLGFEVLRELGIKHFNIRIKGDWVNNGNNILAMDRFLEDPYFIDNRRQQIVVFSEELATQLMLYSGDLKAFLDAHTQSFGRG